MPNLDIYCFSMKYFNLLDKLPSYIKPFGLGNNKYPENWLTEQNGESILNLNKYYGEASGVYWVWKNKLKNIDENDWIGTCHYRRLWLNNLYKGKQKSSLESLYDNLLKSDNNIFLDCETIQVQPILLKNETICFLSKIFFEQPNEIIFRSLSDLMRKVGKRYYSARGKSIVDVILKIKSRKLKKITLGGCLIEKVNETVLISREKTSKG